MLYLHLLLGKNKRKHCRFNANKGNKIPLSASCIIQIQLFIYLVRYCPTPKWLWAAPKWNIKWINKMRIQFLNKKAFVNRIPQKAKAFRNVIRVGASFQVRLRWRTFWILKDDTVWSGDLEQANFVRLYSTGWAETMEDRQFLSNLTLCHVGFMDDNQPLESYLKGYWCPVQFKGMTWACKRCPSLPTLLHSEEVSASVLQ